MVIGGRGKRKPSLFGALMDEHVFRGVTRVMKLLEIRKRQVFHICGDRLHCTFFVICRVHGLTCPSRGHSRYEITGDKKKTGLSYLWRSTTLHVVRYSRQGFPSFRSPALQYTRHTVPFVRPRV